MKYRDFEGSIEELVALKLKEIEEKEHVTILHAVESGSRSQSIYKLELGVVRRNISYILPNHLLNVRDNFSAQCHNNDTLWICKKNIFWISYRFFAILVWCSIQLERLPIQIKLRWICENAAKFWINPSH
mgnify:CR=1 FL=1